MHTQIATWEGLLVWYGSIGIVMLFVVGKWFKGLKILGNRPVGEDEALCTL